METTIVEQNNNTNTNEISKAKKEHFKDGDFVVPTKYVCNECGREYHVRKEVLIKRINKQFDGYFNKWKSEAICSGCKKSKSVKEVVNTKTEEVNITKEE